MPRDLSPRISTKLSDTGQNLGYRCDPLLKEKVIAFDFFFKFDCPRRVIVQDIKFKTIRHPSVFQSRRSNRRADKNV